MSPLRIVTAIGASLVLTAALSGQGNQGFTKHPAIMYATRPTADPVAALNRQLIDGKAKLTFDQRGGYLRAVLDALKVPLESQLLVYSESSLQSDFITQKTPRALYFNDTV